MNSLLLLQGMEVIGGKQWPAQVLLQISELFVSLTQTPMYFTVHADIWVFLMPGGALFIKPKQTNTIYGFYVSMIFPSIDLSMEIYLLPFGH